MLASVSQGWMFGGYVSGLGTGWNCPLFAAAIAVALAMAYVLMDRGQFHPVPRPLT